MRISNFILACLLVCVASVVNAQEDGKRHAAFPQQPAAEKQRPATYEMPVFQHTALPYTWNSYIPVQTSEMAANTVLLDSSTYKYRPLHLPFAISSSSRSYIGLMDVYSVNGSMQWQLGRMTLAGGATANGYLYYGNSIWQYGVSGQLAYSISPSVSVTLFGEYYSSNPFISMAAYPYVSTTKYGGYMTAGSNRFFIDLGVERRYNAIERRMETVPIVTPGFKVSKKLVIGLPFGDFAKYLIMDSAPKRQRPMAPPKRH